MNKKAIYISCIVVVLIAIVLAVYLFYTYPKKLKNISEINNNDIVVALKANQDAKEYMESHKDFKIVTKTILTKDDILQGQNGQNFKEVYLGLELEDSRYIKIDLMNEAGSNGLVAVFDFKEDRVLRAYGIMLLKTDAQFK
jgi:cell division protein YceG involved in septum cleavage